VIRWGGSPVAIDILQKSSLDVSPGEILERVGQSALFSVDGSHTEECAFHDLKLADAVLHPQAVSQRCGELDVPVIPRRGYALTENGCDELFFGKPRPFNVAPITLRKCLIE
jgi:hypothetical protein